MKITVDRNMPLAPEAFATLGDVQVVDGRTLRSRDLQDTTLLAIRSTTKVNAGLLEGTPVQFVGTATIGTDHLDIPYLERRGMHWAYSPGCNARSVAEYLTAALLHLATKYEQPLTGQTLGIIGVGNVGQRVATQARALGLHVLCHDPPRERAEGPQAFCGIERILDEADFISMHVPLEKRGPDATYHMVDQDFLARTKRGAFFINAARGAIVDTPALIQALDDGQIQAAVVDTWEGEPAISPELLNRVTIGTPHIAGHSYEGKLNGTLMVYAAACRFLGRPPTFAPEQYLPPPLLPQIAFPCGQTPWDAYHQLVAAIYDIAADDARLRETQAHPEAFDTLRRHYPIRREFATTCVTDIPSPHAARIVRALGFPIAP